MRVLVTGATGFVGSAIVEELQAAGHQVLGLARSAEAASLLRQRGVEVQHGSLTELSQLQAACASADGVIHTAFIHDFSRFRENCEIDRQAILAMGQALAGSTRPLLITSGTGLVAATGSLAVESDPAGHHLPRVASEQAAAAVAELGVAVSVVRLPPSVHGRGDHGFVPILIELARTQGQAACLGDGSNRWPAVHRLDAARLFRLALERGATAACYHANAEEGVAFAGIATAIAEGLQLPFTHLPPEQGETYFGWFAHFAALDNPTSSQLTRQLLGWQPQQPGLLDDLRHGGYFA
ncbi:3-beta hydroxysteroid dehydrogenase [Pokkaliibacter plantistimulans]|uniref:3-beta hydroxysteroid dehydrogenase n=1 Tax=Proteobacteria bacterium 228 TaxID=2083153 RepID=A0A2S5KSS6_9PROT|nr:SDR family oxidoreductase [Pokkaliibacter plantistimulans]PPC77894.1 3-beta hydroxysteroid dehydrogenase [Pokkaliibacter plantistimulans]